MKILTRVVKCAFCGKESEQKVLAGGSILGDIELDTRPAEFGRDNFTAEICECPHCRYCNFTIETTDAMPVEFSKSYIDLAYSEKYTRLAIRYWLAAMLYEAVGDSYTSGMLYLKAAWAFDDNQDQESAIIARKNAAYFFAEYVDNTNDGEILLVLIDVLRRAGGFDSAIKWIDEVEQTGIDEVDNVLRFQRNLCVACDSNPHTYGEVTNA